MSEDWSELFTVFEQSLNQWLTRAVEPTPAPAAPSSEPIASRLFAERLQRLQAYFDKAEHEAEQALDPLATDIQVLQQWLDALKSARSKMGENGAS